MEKDKLNKTDDELLEHFFGVSHFELPDEGFSSRVMQRLPQRARRMNQIWTTVCFAVAMALFVLFDGVAELRTMASNILGNAIGHIVSVQLNLYTLLLPLAALSILSLVGAYNVLANRR